MTTTGSGGRRPASGTVGTADPGIGPQGRRPLLVAVDGRSGAGKTSLAAALADAVRTGTPETDVTVVHLEDLYPGWDGLAAGMAQYRDRILAPLATGLPARWTSWDWTNDRPGEEHPVAPADVVIAEGVGAGHAAARPLLDLLAWVEVEEAERRRRALARDGETYRPHWSRWARQEEAWLAGDDVAGAADVVIAPTGPAVPVDALLRAVRSLRGQRRRGTGAGPRPGRGTTVKP